jgi:hypothetical protein
VIAELTVVQFVLSVLLSSLYVKDPGAGEPSDNGAVQFSVTIPFVAVATKFVGALGVVVTTCCGTTTVTRPPDVCREVANPMVEFTEVNVVTENVITVEPAVG